MKDRKPLEDMMDLLEKPVITYIQHLLKEVGHEATEEEAGNLLSNIGTHRLLKNLRADSSKEKIAPEL